MARYTCSFAVTDPSQHLPQSLVSALESCNLEMIYDTGDYLMARENPGQVSFAQLVRVEILIDKIINNSQELRMHFVVKNEELPLQVNNHCRQMFDAVLAALKKDEHWNLLESVES